jgi:hypothetical protein
VSDDLVKWAREAQVFCPADWGKLTAMADRIEALERGAARLREMHAEADEAHEKAIDRYRLSARRGALEEAARVAETLGVDPQTNTNTDAYRHKRYIATAIRALKEDK